MSNVSQIYKRTEVIGRGKFGIVYKGIHRTTKQVYAIKVLNLDTSEDEVKDVQMEIQFLSRLKQVPNVTHYYGSYLNGTKLWIIMDHCAGGSLRTLLRPGRLEEKYIGVIVREVLIALQYIHKQDVIHRDIKAANVLITNEGKVQLCDFGVAAQLSATNVRRNTIAGTPYWMAPEVIMEGTSYDVKADIWSLGITIYEIATGNPPYCDKEAMRAMQLITKSKPPRLEGKQYSQLLKEIIALCLDENPTERLSAEELLKTKFIKHYKNSPTLLLKEIISRYLLWRERKSSRESIMINVEDDAEENEIEVKWDFDSLSSSDYILENDINVSNINLNEHDDYEYDDYDDSDDEFMTGYQGSKVYGNGTTKNHTSNITYNKNTVTYNTNIGSTLKDNGTRKEAPKSLLQLFEEEEDYEEKEDESQYELPKISSSVGLHSLHQSNSVTPRVSTPIKEIEIPNFEEMESLNIQQHNENITRSRANTLAHTQSAAVLDTRKTLDPGLTRRPTVIGTMHTSQSLMQPPLQSTMSMSQIGQNPPTSLPPNIPRVTPSPKRDLRILTSPSNNNGQNTSSPNKSSTSMKALASPNNQSPLLQPLNASASSLSNISQIGESTLSASSVNGNISIKRNYQNLRLQMPTPTVTRFPKLLHSNSTVDENGFEEPVNQFGVNVSNVPLAMTPLTEKPPSQPSSIQSAGKTIANNTPNASIISNLSMTSTTTSITSSSSNNPTQAQLKRKLTNTIAQPPSLMPFLTTNQRTGSSVSSQSSVDGTSSSSTLNSTDVKITLPSLDISLFMDDGFNKEKLNSEVLVLLNGVGNLLGLMEDKLNTMSE